MWQKPDGTSMPIVVFGPLADDAVAANQTNVQLTLAPLNNDGIVMPVAGWVVGMVGSLSAAGSAGSLTVGVSIDGTEDSDTTVTITTETEINEKWKTDDGAPRFEAGEQIGVEITTDASWNGTTADLAVFLLVVLDTYDV